MLFVILGIVVLVAILVPILLPMDGGYTHKKCRFCRRSIKIEEVKCRHCKKHQLEEKPDES